MSEKRTRSFRLTPEQEQFVDGAKVQGNNTAPDDAAQHNTKTLPWEDLSAGSKTINFRFSPEQNAKAIWAGKNVPGGISKSEMLRYGLELAFEELKNRHYKPGEK